mgnify:CR=1 FL=1
MGYISLGTYNKYYKYIIFYIISNLLYESTFGLNYGNVYKEIIFLEQQELLRKHSLIISIFNYFLIFLLSLILYKCNPDKNANCSNRNDSSAIKLIVYKNKKIKKQYYTIILVSILWVIHEQLGIFYYNFNFAYLDYWTLEILITYFISSKMFNIQIYKHQKFAIFFNSVLCSLFLLFPFIMKLFYAQTNSLIKQLILIPTGIICYLIIMFIRSYSNCKIKWVSDLLDISISKILIFYGFFGTIICSLASLFTNFVECNEYIINCYLEKDDKKYFENFSIFFNDFSSSKLIFSFLIIFNIIFGFLKSLFYIIIIKYLTPFHAIVLPSLYYVSLFVILCINTLINKKEKNSVEKIEAYSAVCDFIADLLTIFGTSIYSEIIELNFCKFNYNLRRNIIKRGNIDFYTNSFKEGKEGQIFPDDDSDHDSDNGGEETERKNELSQINNKK